MGWVGNELGGGRTNVHRCILFFSPHTQIYSKLLFDVVHGADLRQAVVKAAQEVGVDVENVAKSGMSDTDVVQRHFGSACYITSSLPVVLYLAYKHAGDFEGAVLANVNAGGENAHRGAALGALMGAAVGYTVCGDVGSVCVCVCTHFFEWWYV